MKRVFTASSHDPSKLGSSGSARYMLMRQYQFPDYYEEGEEYHSFDSDRMESFAECCEKYHVNQNNLLGLCWEGNDQKILAFIIDVLNSSKRPDWTGYRILATVTDSGHTVWSFGLFAKNPKSNTVVYSELMAPNIEVEDPLN